MWDRSDDLYGPLLRIYLVNTEGSIKNCPMAETFHVDTAQEPLDGSSPRAFRWAGYPSWTVQLGGRCSITALNEWTCLFVHRLPLLLVSPPLVLHN